MDFIEFVNLYIEACDDIKAWIERTLAEVQPQTESQD